MIRETDSRDGSPSARGESPRGPRARADPENADPDDAYSDASTHASEYTDGLGRGSDASEGSFDDGLGYDSRDSLDDDPARRVLREDEKEPVSFWNALVADGMASLGCGPLTTSGSAPKDPKERPKSARKRGRTIKGARRFLGHEVRDEDVIAEIVNGSGGDESERGASRRRPSLDSETERRRERREGRKSLHDDTGVGADGAAFELEAREAEAHGDSFPNVDTVRAVFRDMISTLKDSKTGQRAKKKQKLEDRHAALDHILDRPGTLYALNAFVRSPAFNFFVYFCIACVTVTSGLETSPAISANPILKTIGLTLSCVFALEAALKIVSAGVTVTTEDGKTHLIESNPARYFHDPMNALDFFVVLVSFSEYFTDYEGGSGVVVLRLLRLARVLKVVTVVPELQVILRGVGAGCKSIGWILLLLFGVVYVYAVLGVLLFRHNDPRHFRNLPAGIGTTLNIATGEFIECFYVNYHGCDRYGYDDDPRCVAPDAQRGAACAYFSTLILVVGQIMMSLFVGIITNKMEQAAEHLRETKSERARASKAADSMSVFRDRDAARGAFGSDDFARILNVLDVVSGKDARSADLGKESGDGAIAGDAGRPRLKRAQDRVQRVTSHWAFEAFVVTAIFVAGIESGVETWLDADSPMPGYLTTIGQVVLGIFIGELLLKMFVVCDAPAKFFRGEEGTWNAFDLMVVLAALIPSRIESLATAVRLLRLLRLLKLIRAVPQLQVIVRALMRGMASIVYVGLLMALVFYVYGIAGVHLFRANDPFHFGTLGAAFITLFRISMMEDWKTVVMINVVGCGVDAYGEDDGGATYADVTGTASAEPPLCSSSEAVGVLAAAYFSSFIVLGALVLVSVFVGIIVTGMQDATEAMNIEIDRRRRAKVTAEYFDLDRRAVEDMFATFRVLDVDGSEALTLEELKDVMRSLGVPAHPKFLRDAVDVFAPAGKEELDESDFLLLVMLCERAMKNQRESAIEGKPFYGNESDDRESLKSDFANIEDPTAKRGILSAASGSLRSMRDGLSVFAPAKPAPRHKLAVSRSVKQIGFKMDRLGDEVKATFGKGNGKARSRSSRGDTEDEWR